MSTVNIEVELTDQSKEILNEIFKDEESKLSIIKNTVKFVSQVISKDKLRKYTNEIKNIIEIEKGNGSEIIESVEILISIRKIIEDLYNYLESIKKSLLDKSSRNFIKNNIDLIQQVVIILAIQGLDEINIINRDTLVNILSFVKTVNNISINMKIKNFFLTCCFKKTE
ncbi:hypothetical protein QJ854_gp671 [Moumouvirus goulette]|uniref:Uncharacterized protein n=1 Tax=Moumouvirus goulette TaxID=1247379 RepID=M1PMD8_9VIRU|nr:hypothetical protein QJ854_gp671 [Moumouvirus goulette]AGF85111.1 hypothetical protein glt_00302 [Moumouvirus goulette]